jgi:hypothetical protein
MYQKLVGGSEFVISEVLTEVTVKSTVFWDVRMCSEVEVRKRFG